MIPQFKLIPNKENGSMTSLVITEDNYSYFVNDPRTKTNTITIPLTEKELVNLVNSLQETREDILENLNTNKLKTLEDENEVLKGEIDSLNEKINGLENEIDNLKY